MTSWVNMFTFSGQHDLYHMTQHSTLQLPAPKVNRLVIGSSRARQNGLRCSASESENLGRFPILALGALEDDILH